MFHRLFIVGVVFFWMLMTGALVQLWVNPASSEVLSVPVLHVARQVFVHEQTSRLSVFQAGKQIGSLTLQPRRFDESGICMVDFTGNLIVALPFLAEQSFSWRGTAEMNRSFALHHLKLHIDAIGPKVTTELELDPGRNRATYILRQQGEEPLENSLTLDTKGIEDALRSVGVDPTVLNQITLSAKSAADSSGPLSVTARQSEIKIQGERVQTYRVAARQSNTPMIEADISHYGQILSVKTMFGLSFAPEE